MTGALGQAPNGWQPDQTRFEVVNRAGAATLVGGVYRLALDTTDGDVTGNTIGDVAGGFGAIVDPDTDIGDWQGILVVAEEAVADNARLMVTISGVVDILVDGTTDVADNDPLEVESGQTNALILATDGAALIYAIALADQATDSAVLISCLFNGAYGFGGGSVVT